MKIGFVLAVAVLLAGCSSEKEKQAAREEAGKQQIEMKEVQVRYIYDVRTDLCFVAGLSSDRVPGNAFRGGYRMATVFGLTSIPCTPKVKAIAKPAA
jgi:hypothetical protein